MKAMLDIGHPAHVHLFKNMVWNLQSKGHEVFITSRGKEVLCYLLDVYGFKYQKLSDRRAGLVNLARELMIREYKFYELAKRFKPDILCGLSEIITHTGKLIGKPSIMFTDTEHAELSNLITFPFADVICTPSCFKKDLGKKHVRYNGYHELAYLHPNYFTPDPSVLGQPGLTENDKFVIVRFVAWQASHDVGQHGLDLQSKRKLVEELSKHARVLISSESSLPDEFEQYRITTPPEKMHDLLCYATMYIGEGGTMATEAAILGTPSVLINPEARLVGIHEEFRDKYGLLHFYSTAGEALKDILELLKDKTLKSKWREKRERLLNEKIDVTRFMVNFIENYPRSFYERQQMKEEMH